MKLKTPLIAILKDRLLDHAKEVSENGGEFVSKRQLMDGAVLEAILTFVESDAVPEGPELDAAWLERTLNAYCDKIEAAD
jgi:hypothetical protein